VPAYNESAKIAEVIADLKRNGYQDIVVIDDGSVDNTGAIAEKLGVVVLRHIVNRGLGAALGTGFAYARSQNLDVLVTFDSDGQHQASDILRLVEPIKNGQADVVIGSRWVDSSKMPILRRFYNFASNILTFVLYGVSTTDSLSGLRAFSQKSVEVISIRTNKMEVSNEFFQEISRNHLRYMEVPIRAIYTDYSRANSKNLINNPLPIVINMLIRLFR